MSLSQEWDKLTMPAPDSMRGRMLADEELSEAEFKRLARRIALEAHEDRLKLWETALERYERLNARDARIAALETKYADLWHALKDLLEQIDLLDDITYGRDTEAYKAEACWNDAYERARKALRSTLETKGVCNCGSPYGPHKPDCNVFVECPTPKIGAKHGY